MKIYAFIFINWTYNYDINIHFTHLRKKSGRTDTSASARRDLLVSNLTALFVNLNYRKVVDWVHILLSILSRDFL